MTKLDYLYATTIIAPPNIFLVNLTLENLLSKSSFRTEFFGHRKKVPYSVLNLKPLLPETEYAIIPKMYFR